jgi:hypothetical protein
MDGIRDHQVKGNESDSESQILHAFSCMQNVDLREIHEYKKRTVWGKIERKGRMKEEGDGANMMEFIIRMKIG